jgi:hypothetical protein
MKFYIASSVANKEQVRDLFRSLEDAGHSVTVDWTETDFVPVHMRDSNEDHIRAIAKRDFDGVLGCDAFVLLSEPAEGRSMYAELGMAIAHYAATGQPLVFVLGKENDQSVFHYHPAVRRVNSIDEILGTRAEESSGTLRRLVHEGRLEEYRALRAEMLEIIKDRIWGQATYAVFCAGVLSLTGSGYRAVSLNLVIGLAIPFLFHTIFREHARIRMGNYMRVFLEPKIPGMFWEEYLVMWRSKFGKQKSEGWLTPRDRLKHTFALSGMYLVASIFCWALLIGFTDQLAPKVIGSILLSVVLFSYLNFYGLYDKGEKERMELMKLDGRRN